ncbi:MAG: hypothetical protein AABX16_05305 [Nanoarchaeota archaeon]
MFRKRVVEKSEIKYRNSSQTALRSLFFVFIFLMLLNIFFITHYLPFDITGRGGSTGVIELTIEEWRSISIDYPINTTYNFSNSSGKYPLQLNVSSNFNSEIHAWMFTLIDVTNNIILNNSEIFTPNTTIYPASGSNTLTVIANRTGNYTINDSVTFFISVSEGSSNDDGGGGGGSSGGGSGGGAGVLGSDFIVNPDSMKVLIKENESFQLPLTIKNMKPSIQAFSFVVSDSLQTIVSLSESYFALTGEEEKTITVSFNSNNSGKGVYTGNIKVKGNTQTKEIPIVVSIKSKNVLFDVSLDIPPRYRELYAGDELLLQITLFNLAGVEKTNVSMEYLIKDFDGKIIYSEHEIVAVETQVSYDKIIKLPATTKIGEYVALVQARYESSLGSSNAVFHVVEKETPYSASLWWLILIFILALFLFLLRKRRKKKYESYRGAKLLTNRKKSYEKVHERSNFGKLHALETAFREGYISKKSYERGKSRLKK